MNHRKEIKGGLVMEEKNDFSQLIIFGIVASLLFWMVYSAKKDNHSKAFASQKQVKIQAEKTDPERYMPGKTNRQMLQKIGVLGKVPLVRINGWGFFEGDGSKRFQIKSRTTGEIIAYEEWTEKWTFIRSSGRTPMIEFIFDKDWLNDEHANTLHGKISFEGASIIVYCDWRDSPEEILKTLGFSHKIKEIRVYISEGCLKKETALKDLKL